MSLIARPALLRGKNVVASVIMLLATLSAGQGLSATNSGSSVAHQARALPSLCNLSEVPLFQCAIGAKQLAICAGDVSSQGVVQYRYGAPGKLELVYPAAPQTGAASLKWAMTGYSGGGETQVSFDRSGVEYVVYSRMTRTGFGKDGHNDPKDELGVAVLKGDHLVSDRRCGVAKIEGGHSDWIDEQRTMRLLPKGEFVDH